jgi:hypothetical protein
MEIGGIHLMYSAQTQEDIANEILGQKREKRVWPVWHRTCRDIAFFYDQPVCGGIEIKSAHSYDYNGRHPEPGSQMVCGACKETMKVSDVCSSRPGEFLAMPGENFVKELLKQ